MFRQIVRFIFSDGLLFPSIVVAATVLFGAVALLFHREAERQERINGAFALEPSIVLWDECEDFRSLDGAHVTLQHIRYKPTVFIRFEGTIESKEAAAAYEARGLKAVREVTCALREETDKEAQKAIVFATLPVKKVHDIQQVTTLHELTGVLVRSSLTSAQKASWQPPEDSIVFTLQQRELDPTSTRVWMWIFCAVTGIFLLMLPITIWLAKDKWEELRLM